MLDICLTFSLRGINYFYSVLKNKFGRRDPELKRDFWDVLKDGGGDWMWEFVDDKYKGGDMD